MADSAEGGFEPSASPPVLEAVSPPPVPGIGAVLPVRAREVFSVLLIVALCDLTIYRGHGFAGVALLLVVCPLLFVMGSPLRSFGVGFWLVVGMLLALAARLVWLGSFLGVASGIALLVALAVALQGKPPHVLEVAASALRSIASGGAGLLRYGAWASRLTPQVARSQWLGVLLPLAALALFGALFVLANPDLVKQVADLADRLLRAINRWLGQVPFHVREVVFWMAVAWLVVGLLRPGGKVKQSMKRIEPSAITPPLAASEESMWYRPVCNTLVSVIVLFAIYLVFDFRSLWFREFPQGFYYAGYAHEGAAWLTTALAFATLMLSMIFCGGLLKDPRIGHLRKLAWIWSAENLVLALTVYNRLQIYVNFNGMTRMRMVALFGTSAVVAGFLLVVWKILRNHNFAWLVRNQLWALALAVYLFAITPVDAIVHRYNVRHVMAGDLPPVVQITEHPVNSEGILMLEPLMVCKDPIIREGIRAMLAERALSLEALEKQRAELGWTTYQFADNRCLNELRNNRESWKEYIDTAKRTDALDRFRKYAYQWY